MIAWCDGTIWVCAGSPKTSRSLNLVCHWRDAGWPELSPPAGSPARLRYARTTRLYIIPTNEWTHVCVCALDTKQEHAALTGQWRHQNYHLTDRMQKNHFLLTCFCFLLISFCCGNDYCSSSGSDKRMQDKASEIDQIKNKIKTQIES